MIGRNSRYSTEVDTMYHILVDSVHSSVTVRCIGMYCIDSPIDGKYSGVDQLPEWIQEKLALLMMTDCVPVSGVGRRVNAETFWVYG
jgi:hypothetical protein